ncbi:MAG TPA: hypothetical protein VD908_14185 [Cytophagales bacterium]|nr:hypothetical protein [Cytophagales bacterium]
MLTSTLYSKVALDWYEEKELMTSKGLIVPCLVINSTHTSILGIPLIPFAIKPFCSSFYLKNNYQPGIAFSKELVQRGDLDLELSLKLPEETGINTVFFHQATISLINKSTQKVLGTSKIGAGNSPSFSISALLDENSCDHYYRIIRGVPSALHVLVQMKFYVPKQNELKTIESIQPLSKIIQLSGISRGMLLNHLKIKYYDTDAKGFIDAPSRQQINPLIKRKNKITEPLFIAKSNVVATNNAILQPVTYLSAGSLVNSPFVNFTALAVSKLENISLVSIVESLPVVESEERKWYKDNKDPDLCWVIPEFKTLIPNRGEDPILSPFRFLFRQIGMDISGKPVLEGEVTFSLKAQLSENIKKEILDAHPDARFELVSTKNISVNLEIPFFNESNQLTTTTLITEEFRWNQDTLIVTFRMSNDWVRVSYGLLSAQKPEFENKLKINLAYAFEGMGKKDQKLDKILLNQNIFKIAALPVVTKKSRNKPSNRYFDFESKTLVLENGQNISFDDSRKPRSKSAKPIAGKLAILNTSKITQPAINKVTLLPLVHSGKINRITEEKKFIKRTFIRREKIDIGFDCTKHGAFYQEQNNQGNIQSIGCKQPYKLGEINFSLYVPLTEIQHPDFSVYQSTQIPNRFLVVPKRYVVTRFEPDKGDMAFHPCLRLYSTIDAENLERSRCILDATLAPDIHRFELEELHFRLSEFTSYTPYISFPGEIEHTEVYNWAIPETLIEDIDSFSLGHFIRMVLSAKIQGVLTLHSLLKNAGLSGKVNFTLPDGSVYSSELMISLESIKGPFINGALITEKQDSTISLKNGLTHRLQLTEIHAYKNYEDKKVLPIEKTLEGGEETIFNADSDRIHVPRYIIENVPETLSEIRKYLEDIECQVLFITNIDIEKEKIKQLLIRFGLSQEDLHETSLTKDKTVAEELLIMPLTNFFDQREIQYSIAIEKEDAEIIQGDWITVSLADGNIINITSSAIHPS